MASYLDRHSHKKFCLWCTQKCGEATFFHKYDQSLFRLFIRRGKISPRCYMQYMGVHLRAPFCRSLSIPMSWNRRHKLWCCHILALKAKTTDPSFYSFRDTTPAPDTLCYPARWTSSTAGRIRTSSSCPRKPVTAPGRWAAKQLICATRMSP